MKPVRVGVLAALLLAVAAVPASATTINYATGTNVSGMANFFAFGGAPSGEKVQFWLEFDQVLTGGSLDVTITQTASIPGINCVPIGGPGTCVIFNVVPSTGLTWDTANGAGFDVRIAWTFDTNTQFPDSPAGTIRLLHNHGSGWTDITTPGSYCTTCSFIPGGGDPSIGGRDNNFSGFTVDSSQAVATPEPTSLVLMGSGLALLAAGLRRRARQ